jgi:hypothetical protein
MTMMETSNERAERPKRAKRTSVGRGDVVSAKVPFAVSDVIYDEAVRRHVAISDVVREAIYKFVDGLEHEAA